MSDVDTSVAEKLLAGPAFDPARHMEKLLAGLNFSNLVRTAAEMLENVDWSTVDGDSVGVASEPISDVVRFVIAVYCAVLVISACAWYYVAHPKAANLVLDAATPTGWAIWLGWAVYQLTGKLRTDGEGGFEIK